MQEIDGKLRADLQVVANYLQTDLIKALEAKGHNTTGDLSDSVKVKVLKELNGFNIQGGYLFYGEYVDRGRAAGLQYVPIDALIDWVRNKKLVASGDEKDIKGMAYAVQQKIRKEGIKGKRWQSETLDIDEPRITADIEKAVDNIIAVIIQNMIEETQKLITNG